MRQTPSPLQTSPLIDVAYRLDCGGWYTHPQLEPWGAYWLIETCLDLGRTVRIRTETGHIDQFEPTGDPMARRLLLLDLFSIPVSDLSGLGTDHGP